MATKTINIQIPYDKNIDNGDFSPEENYVMLKVGCECLLEARKAIAVLTQREMFNKMKEESKGEVKKLEIDCLVQKELFKQLEVSLQNMYETFISKTKESYEHEKSQLNKTICVLNEQVRQYENDSGSIINLKIECEREKWKEREIELDLKIVEYEKKSEEYEKKGEKMRATYELMLANTNRSNSAKGSEGEKQFQDLAVYTFKDFNGFEIVDKHTKGGEGDFHLHFDEFNVLADAKNYKSNVPSTQREKIKKDLIKNEHIQFGWLVSLHSSIDKYDRCSIMYEWINTKQCLVYINNLCSFEDPSKLLRIVWFTCKELNRFAELNNEYDDEELVELKEHKFMMVDKIKALRKTVKEANTSINTLKNIVQTVDEQLREMLGKETNEIVDSNSSLFDDWWDVNIEVVEDDSIVESVTDIWFKFRQENKDIIKKLDITMDKFKQFVKLKVPLSRIVTKTKSVSSTFDIKGVKIKKIRIKTEKKPDDVSVPVEFYFNEVTDVMILEEYKESSLNIMSIADRNVVRPWQVVSVLLRHKVISKRDDARGYDVYKQTEEYQSKLKIK
jgi:hypothetical protein